MMVSVHGKEQASYFVLACAHRWRCREPTRYRNRLDLGKCENRLRETTRDTRKPSLTPHDLRHARLPGSVGRRKSSRCGSNTPRAEAVVALARAYGRSPVEALVAAGYLSSSELGVVEMTTLTGDLSGASIDSLLSEIGRRVHGANPVDSRPWPTGWSTDDPGFRRGKDDEQSGDLNG
ncbi:MAG: hypothetical protein QOD39_1732 [Mycobacterium sp.]|nr:hypothetical protein [Mycobacterium sp.]